MAVCRWRYARFPLQPEHLSASGTGRLAHAWPLGTNPIVLLPIPVGDTEHGSLRLLARAVLPAEGRARGSGARPGDAQGPVIPVGSAKHPFQACVRRPAKDFPFRYGNSGSIWGIVSPSPSNPTGLLILSATPRTILLLYSFFVRAIDRCAREPFPHQHPPDRPEASGPNWVARVLP